VSSLDPILLIGLSLLGSALLGRFWHSPMGQPTRPRSKLGIHALDVVLLAAAGLLIVSAIHTAMNPRWLPMGQDWREFILLSLDIQSGGAYLPVPQRYPAYPWLAIQLAQAQGLPLHLGLMQLSLISAGLIPAALYTLGVQLTRRPVAITGALLSLFIPTIIAILGPPTDYLLHGLVHTLCLSAGTAALLRGGPWRMTAWGISLAMLMAVTMKSLPVLLMAAPLAVLGLFLTARRSRTGAAWSLVGLVLPGLMIWQLYSGLQRWVGDAYTLDYNVYRTQVVVARSHGRTTTFPADLGWHPTDEKQMGFWGVGRAGAWTNLPKTLAFLARGPDHNLPQDLRLQSASTGLAEATRLPGASWLVLALLGILQVGSQGRPMPWGRLLGTTWVVGMTAAHFMGLMSTLYIARYALVLLLPLPLLLLGGGAWLLDRFIPAHHRDHDRPWWLLLVGSALAVLTGQSPPGIQPMLDKQTPEALELSLNVHESFWDWRDSLTAQDQVIDLTENLIVADLVESRTQQVITIKTDNTDVSLRPHPAGRRFLVLPGCLNMGTSQRVWTPHDASPDRLQEIWTHLVQDSTPQLPLRVSRKP
jgi:hypothetical protein